MLTSPACLPCFIRQAEYAVSLATADGRLREKVMDAVSQLVPGFDLTVPPPYNSISLYRLIAKMTGHEDIFADLKHLSNRHALEMLPALEDKICRSADPLHTATRLAIAGNIIDYGSHQNFDVQLAMDSCLSAELRINDFAEFRDDLHRAGNILFLGDNCGELVFDRLLIGRLGKPVTLAVKEKPIINDALRSDAEFCGLGGLCRIISNGTDCPGTPLDKCSGEFRREFAAADLIISKGQGNFETLSETGGPIYFLLMSKCSVVSEHVAAISGRPAGSVKQGDIILMKNRKARSA